MRRRARIRLAIAAAAVLGALPLTAHAADTTATSAAGVAADTVWVVIAALLVLFMQAGFAMLEVGFTRMKNVGTVVAKIIVNLSISSVVYWVCGFAFAFGAATGFTNSLIGFSGFAPSFHPGSTMDLPALAASTAPAAAKYFFEFVFCAVSLAIVWGTMLERTRFIVYILFAVPFAGFIYPMISHWLFGGGWLMTTLGAQDFAGSTVVHLTGATAGFAGLLLLGARIGKYSRDGKPNAIPGHNMPLAQLGVIILWFGWFGFNPGSTLNATNLHFADVVITTNLAAAAGALAAMATIYRLQKALDVGMIGNGAIAALVAITAPSGYVQPWAAVIIGAVAGVIVVFGVIAIDRWIDDPVGALSAHGLAGIWGTLSCGLFTDPQLAAFNGVGQGGLFYTGSLKQLGAQAAAVGAAFVTVFALSYGLFWIIKRTVGLRVSDRHEIDGLDISEHGMWGYPEQFMPVPGGAYIHPDAVGEPARRLVGALVPTTVAERSQTPDGVPNVKKVEAVIRPEKLQAVQDAMDELGASGLTVTEVMGCGAQRGYTETYRGARANISLQRKIKVETVVGESLVESVVNAISGAATTGEVGDGKIFVLPVDDAVRIRNGERGDAIVRHLEPERWGH